MELNFTDTGSGPPLVILHGLFGSARNWASIASSLSDSYRVIAVDLPNHGASPWMDEVTFEKMADAVRAFMTAQGLNRAAVLGHSMGGKTAMVLALRHPEAVGGLIVADIAPAPNDFQQDNVDYINALRAIPLDEISRRAEADGHLAEHIAEPGLRAFLLQNLVQEEGAFRWRINLDVLFNNLDAIHGFPEPEESFQGPALFVTGGQSRYVRPHHNDLIRNYFPNAGIAVMEHVGHWLHAEDPEGFVEIVRDFLGAVD